MRKEITPSKCKELFSRFNIEAGVFTFLFVSFICGVKSLDIWVSALYSMNYSLGFGSRMLIGSILKLFYTDYLNSWLIYSFVIVCMIVVLVLISFFIGFCIRNAPSKTAKQGITLLSFLYLACPASPGYLWAASNMGKFDLYLLLLSLLNCFVFLKISSFTLQCVFWGIIGVLCVAIHQVYIFIFFPLTLVMIAGKWFDSEWNPRYILAGTATILAVCCSFVFFQFFSHINVASVEELYRLLSSKTDIFIFKTALRFDYYDGISDHMELVKSLMPILLIIATVTLILLSPLLAVYGYLWSKAYQLSPQKLLKSKYLWMVLLMLAYLPVFIITVDWGRWFAAFFTVQFLTVLILLQKGDPYLTSAAEYLVGFFKQRKFFFILLILYFAMLGKLSIWFNVPSTDTVTLIENILTLWGYDIAKINAIIVQFIY